MIVPIFLPHLGCGERCTYCDQTYITDIGTDDIGEVVKRYLEPVQGKTEVGLYGGNIFGLGPAALIQLFSSFEPYRDKISNFRISTKPIPLNPETIRILREQGVDNVEMGIPSFNDRILALLNRGHTAEDVRRSFATLKAEGFTVALQVMVGLPEETMADIVETAENLVALKPDYVRIYPLAVLLGTPLEKTFRQGKFIPISFEEAVTRAVYIYLRCTQKGVKVVKMGLTENEVLNARVVAGHHHPSFGYVVKTWAFRLAVLSRIKETGAKGSVTVKVNKKDVPHLLGYKRSNIDRYSKEGVFGAWETDERPEGTFLISYGTKCVEGAIGDALTMIPA